MLLSFRVAEYDDVAAVVALVESAFRGDASRAGWTTEADLLDGQRADEDMVSAVIDTGVLLLAESDGELVACCQLERRGEDVAYLGMLSVRPTLQAGGVGRDLLAEAECRAAESGATRMRMTVIRQRGDLIAWYERRGYRATGETQPFPYGDDRYGLPKVDDLEFVVLEKSVG